MSILKKPIAIILVSLTCLMNLNSQSVDLIIQKTGPTTINGGDIFQDEIIISNNGPDDVANATFEDIFPQGITNGTFISCNAAGGAVCPTASDYILNGTEFIGMVPSIPQDGIITFLIELEACGPFDITSFSNTATVDPPPGATDIDPSTNTSTWNTMVINLIDISSTKTSAVITDECGNWVIDYEVTWTNMGTGLAS